MGELISEYVTWANVVLLGSIYDVYVSQSITVELWQWKW